jgi:hypothetical protein
MTEVSPERIKVIAGAARIALEPGSAERIVRATSVPVQRIASANIEVPLEVEPSSFLVMQQSELRR